MTGKETGIQSINIPPSKEEPDQKFLPAQKKAENNQVPSNIKIQLIFILRNFSPYQHKQTNTRC